MIEIQSRPNIKMPEEKAQLFTQLYEEVFPKVAKFVANRGGTFADAKDIFHDALVVLYEKMLEEKEFESPENYLVGIAKHLWIRKFKDDHRMLALDDAERSISIPEDYYEPAENRIIAVLELTGKKCLHLLRAFYYDDLSLEQIKTVFGFSTTRSASSQKFKCIEKIRNTIQEKSLGYEDFA